jgi:hypothetical protein
MEKTIYELMLMERVRCLDGMRLIISLIKPNTP